MNNLEIYPIEKHINGGIDLMSTVTLKLPSVQQQCNYREYTYKFNPIYLYTHESNNILGINEKKFYDNFFNPSWMQQIPDTYNKHYLRKTVPVFSIDRNPFFKTNRQRRTHVIQGMYTFDIGYAARIRASFLNSVENEPIEIASSWSIAGDGMLPYKDPTFLHPKVLATVIDHQIKNNKEFAEIVSHTSLNEGIKNIFHYLVNVHCNKTVSNDTNAQYDTDIISDFCKEFVYERYHVSFKDVLTLDNYHNQMITVAAKDPSEDIDYLDMLMIAICHHIAFGNIYTYFKDIVKKIDVNSVYAEITHTYSV